MTWLRYANQGATRNRPLDPRLVSALGFLGDMGITAEVYSGGQPAKGSGGKRVGSTRHDHGNAGDFRFYKDGRQLDWARDSDRPLFEEIVRRGRKAGVTGFGAGPGYMGAGTMHVGFGSPGVWGAGGKSANAPDWLRTAFEGGAAPTMQALAYAAEPSSNRGSQALEAAMTGAGAPSSQSGGETMSQRPMINIGPEKSSKLAEALMAQAMNGGDISHPMDLIGRLAQVYSGQRQIKKNDEANKSSLEQALAGANLSPEFAMAAQLGGDRNSLANAIMQQQQMQAQQAQRAEEQVWRSDEREYQRGRDTVGDQRWQQTFELQQQRASEPPAPPSSVREYEYARGQGFEGTFADWEQQNRRAGATNVNVGGGGPKLGSLSTDYGYVLDPQTGEPRIDPATGLPTAAAVPGSPAAREIEAEAMAAAAKDRNNSDYALTVTQDVGIADDYLSEIGSIAGMDGIVGANLRERRANLAGTPEYNMKKFVDSALSNLTLDTMNRMRETSAAGATGMGNMSDRQLAVIQGVLGNWSPGLPVDDQRYILHRLGNFYLDVQVGSASERAEAVRTGRMTAEENEQIQQMYYPETRDQRGRRLDQQAPAPQQQQTGLPQPGQIEDGYRFRGGNPGDPNAWERVQ